MRIALFKSIVQYFKPIDSTIRLQVLILQDIKRMLLFKILISGMESTNESINFVIYDFVEMISNWILAKLSHNVFQSSSWNKFRPRLFNCFLFIYRKYYFARNFILFQKLSIVLKILFVVTSSNTLRENIHFRVISKWISSWPNFTMPIFISGEMLNSNGLGFRPQFMIGVKMCIM